MNDFIGNRSIVQYLSRITIDTLPNHAFLFVGAEHIGKTYLAHAWMSHLGSTELVSLESLKEDGSRGTISVEQVRDCIDQLSRTSLSGLFRVILINRGDDLTEGASNALLKSLEEPPANTLFIICATDSRSLIQTIVSRCFVIRLSLVSQQALNASFGEMDDVIAASVSNRPGVAVELMRDKAALAEEEKRFKSIQYRTAHSFSDGVSEGELDEADRSRIEAFLSSQFHSKKQNISPDRALSLYDSLCTAHQYARSHVSSARALESVFL